MIREHPRFQQTRDHLRLGHPSDRRRPAARLRDGRGRLRPGAGRAGGAARQGQGLRRALPQDPAARAAQRASSSGASPSAPPSSRRPTRGCARASSAAAWRSPPARWARGTGISSPANACGTTGSTASSASIPATSSCTLDNVRPLHPPGRSGADREDHPQGRERGQHLPDRGADRPPDGADALVHLRRGADVRHARATCCASAASPSTSPSGRRPRSAAPCWCARSTTARATRSRSCSRSCA